MPDSTASPCWADDDKLLEDMEDSCKYNITQLYEAVMRCPPQNARDAEVVETARTATLMIMKIVRIMRKYPPNTTGTTP
jgi:hypothetical protein